MPRKHSKVKNIRRDARLQKKHRLTVPGERVRVEAGDLEGALAELKRMGGKGGTKDQLRPRNRRGLNR